MTNFNFQGKLIRHFWGKLIRQSTLIYGVLMARFIYANHKEGKELEKDKIKIIK